MLFSVFSCIFQSLTYYLQSFAKGGNPKHLLSVGFLEWQNKYIFDIQGV